MFYANSAIAVPIDISLLMQFFCDELHMNMRFNLIESFARLPICET